MKKLCPSLLFFLLTVSSSCTLYPRYERPCTEMPEEWRVPENETSTVINVRWWEQFQDPVLVELIQEALESNQDIKIATARIEQFQAQWQIATSQLYPQIFGQALFSRQRIPRAGGALFPVASTGGGEEGADGGGAAAGDAGGAGQLMNFSPTRSPYINDYLMVLSASYQVDLWGKIRSASDAALSDLLAQVEARRTVLLTVISSVASSYIRLRQFDSQLSISFQTLKSREESLRLAEIRFREGLTSELEVKQAISERDVAAIQVIQYRTFIPQEENALSVLIGHPPEAISRGREIYEWGMCPDIPAGLPSDLLEQRPDILQAEEVLKATNFRIGEARALYFPNLSLTGYYGTESSDLANLFTSPARTWQWMINILQPLFTGGRISGTVASVEAQKKQAVYQYVKTILNALREVNDALIGHKNSKYTLQVQYARVKDLKDYLELATLQYDNGLVDYLNVLDAQRRLFAAQLELAQEQAQIFLTLVDVYKSLGGGWVIDAENMLKEEECGKKKSSFKLFF